MSLKGILHKEYENILKICLVFATIVYNLLIFNVNYFRGSEVKEYYNLAPMVEISLGLFALIKHYERRNKRRTIF